MQNRLVFLPYERWPHQKTRRSFTDGMVNILIWEGKLMMNCWKKSRAVTGLQILRWDATKPLLPI